MYRIGRIDTDQTLWLATVRADGRPHLTPIWFVFHDQRIWICTGADTVKTHNVLGNASVSISLEDGTAPVVAEGMATVHQRPYPPAVVEAFITKYDWDISRRDDPDGAYDALIEMTIRKWLMGSPES